MNFDPIEVLNEQIKNYELAIHSGEQEIEEKAKKSYSLLFLGQALQNDIGLGTITQQIINERLGIEHEISALSSRVRDIRRSLQALKKYQSSINNYETKKQIEDYGEKLRKIVSE